jgi:hypothetical protein
MQSNWPESGRPQSPDHLSFLSRPNQADPYFERRALANCPSFHPRPSFDQHLLLVALAGDDFGEGSKP